MNAAPARLSPRRAEIRALAAGTRGPSADILDVHALITQLGGSLAADGHATPTRIAKTGTGTFTIWINGKARPPCRRRDAAHALGHLLLHMGFGGPLWATRRLEDVFVDNVNAGRDPWTHTLQEPEAEEFAWALLMPDVEFQRVASEHLDDGRYLYLTDPIAAHFGVPVAAVHGNGRALGLFGRG